jgi:hypothetical protein
VDRGLLAKSKTLEKSRQPPTEPLLKLSVNGDMLFFISVSILMNTSTMFSPLGASVFPCQ